MGTSTRASLSDSAADVLGQKLMEFCHLLRAHDIEVTASRIIDTFRALKAIDFFRRGDFYTVLEANLISRVSDRELFHQLFLQFWSGPTWASIPEPGLPGWFAARVCEDGRCRTRTCDPHDVSVVLYQLS